MEVMKEGASVNKLNYPENLRKSLIINVPSFFTVVWNMIVPWIDPSTIEKTSVYGSNFLDALLDNNTIDKIPADLGGTGPVLGPGGIYRPNENVVDPIIQEIGAGHSFEKEISIEDAGKLEWEFKVATNDIGFAIYKIEDDQERKELVAYTRMFSNSGGLDLQPGKYLILWDNKYSWTKKKIVHYHITLQKPEN